MRHPRNEAGYRCGSYDRDFHHQAMDFNSSAGWLYLFFNGGPAQYDMIYVVMVLAEVSLMGNYTDVSGQFGASCPRL